MAIMYPDAKRLWEARLRGTSFAKTLTVARLSLYLHPAEVSFFHRAYRSAFPHAAESPLDNFCFGEDTDRFLRTFLGAESVSTMDYSTYEGADIVHDLNEPIPEELRGRFDAVIECGSLEHIFNFPTAIGNLMKTVKVGGAIFISVPANNLCGHGFYQFSPELMFRVFAPENGFELKRVVLVPGVFPGMELTHNPRAYQVADPKSLGSRVGLLSKQPAVMQVEATKIAEVPLFASAPLQSDY
ncbi:MAG: hypothetical protein ABI647_14330, partial [Gemmatimonadota bacterium]